jgi:hypothetical protein
MNSTEKIITNLYGDTADKIVLSSGWEKEYQRYLEGYEKAEDKLEFNRKFFMGVNDNA